MTLIDCMKMSHCSLHSSEAPLCVKSIQTIYIPKDDLSVSSWLEINLHCIKINLKGLKLVWAVLEGYSRVLYCLWVNAEIAWSRRLSFLALLSYGIVTESSTYRTWLHALYQLIGHLRWAVTLSFLISFSTGDQPIARPPSTQHNTNT
jgi:hypothetical protein